MRPSKNEKIIELPKNKIELGMELKLIEQLEAMSKFTSISKDELVATALKRFIAQHSDYFPKGYRSSDN